jgi:hypothetical protein
MLTCNSFHINFQSALSENIDVELSADIFCDYVNGCYVIRRLEIINNSFSNIFNNQIKIKPVVHGDQIVWLHADSLRASILSTAIGKAIEARGCVEMLSKEAAA